MSERDNLAAVLATIDQVDAHLRELIQQFDEVLRRANEALDAAVNLKWDALIYELEQDDEVQP